MANENEWKDSLRSSWSNIDSLFTSENERRYGMIDELEIDQIIPFKNHTFRVVDDDKMDELVSSIKDHGVNEPAIVFINEENNYEMIAGHRRKRACELAGLATIPVIIKTLDRDEATILMGESNLTSRDEILPSEKAFTYKEMLEAMKRSAGRPKKNFGPGVQNFAPEGQNYDARKKMEEKVGESGRNISRYIRLTYLIEPLLKLVDLGKMAIKPAVELSYLDSTLQRDVYNYYTNTVVLDENGKEVISGTLPSVPQAKELRALNDAGELDEDKIAEVLGRLKPNQKEKIVLANDGLIAYKQARDLTDSELEKKIMKALQFYDRYLEKKKEKEMTRGGN